MARHAVDYALRAPKPVPFTQVSCIVSQYANTCTNLFDNRPIVL
jgi:hypothetical protein